jgi:hypothetical protein
VFRKLIEDTRIKGDLSGIKVVGQESISHLLFVDDVLFLSMEP